MRIGELADHVGVSTKTIRYYETIGLLPVADRTESGYRDYGTDARERLRFIQDAQSSGLSLSEIHSIELKDQGERTCEHTRSLLHRQIDDIDERIGRLQEARLALVELAARADRADPSGCTARIGARSSSPRAGAAPDDGTRSRIRYVT